MDARHKQTTQNDPIELGSRSPCKETVELSQNQYRLFFLIKLSTKTYLDEQTQVNILGLGFRTPHFAIVLMVYINGLKFEENED